MPVWENDRYSKHFEIALYQKARNSKQLGVSTISTGDEFMIVDVFKCAEESDESDVGCDETSPDYHESSPDLDESRIEGLHVDVGHWVLVQYEGNCFPDEVTAVIEMILKSMSCTNLRPGSFTISGKRFIVTRVFIPWKRQNEASFPWKVICGKHRGNDGKNMWRGLNKLFRK